MTSERLVNDWQSGWMSSQDAAVYEAGKVLQDIGALEDLKIPVSFELTGLYQMGLAESVSEHLWQSLGHYSLIFACVDESSDPALRRIHIFRAPENVVPIPDR